MIDVLTARFLMLGYARIGQGPKHPLVPNLPMQARIDEFFRKYPRLRLDAGYVEFLEKYSAAELTWPDRELEIMIHGFSPEELEVNDLLTPDEPLYDEFGFFRFCEVIISPKSAPDHWMGVSFAWYLHDDRLLGVYRSVTAILQAMNPVPYEWYRASFVEWFEELIQRQGKLID